MKNIKRASKCLLSAFLIIFLFLFLQHYCFRFYSDVVIRTEGFYNEQKNSLDVVLFGTSEVYNDFSSVKAYEEYNFTSYPIGSPNFSSQLSIYQIKEILYYQNPAVIVVDVDQFLLNEDTYYVDDSRLRYMTDNIPLSKEKIDLINNYAKDDELISYYFPFIKYHGTHDYGSCLDECKTILNIQFNDGSYLKGNYTSPRIYKSKTLDINEKSLKPKKLYGKCEEDLINIINYCNENIDGRLLFVRFPHLIEDEKKFDYACKAVRVGEIVKENGCNFINCDLNWDEIGLDKNMSFYDNDHLNVFGQEKFTSYLGEFIKENYIIENKVLSEECKNNWDESVKYTNLFYEYSKNKTEELENSADEIYYFESTSLLNDLKKLSTN